MQALLEIAKEVIQSYGYAGIFMLTALDQFILPIPSDIYIAIGNASGLRFATIMLMVVPAVIIGDIIGYYIGRRLGHPALLWLFGQKRSDNAEHMIRKWGFWGIVIAGWAPVPFKVITWSAGIFEYPLSKFLLGVFLGHIPRYFLFGYLTLIAVKTDFYSNMEMGAVVLGAIQGLTEFLPISSSGHLALAEKFIKLPPSITAENLQAFDILLHAGSLLAILIYFWREVAEVAKGIWLAVRGKSIRDNLFIKLALGTLPAVIAGLAFSENLMDDSLRGLFGIGLFFILNGLFYLYVEWKGKHAEGETVTLRKSVWIGMAQALALIPSVSRSGLTIGAGLMIGLKREVAAKFSFLLGGVGILAATTYTLLSLRNGTIAWPDPLFSIVGFATSFVFSIISIHWLIKFLRHHTLRPFAFYVILLGVLILTIF